MYIVTKETRPLCKQSVVVCKHKECIMTSCAYRSPLYIYMYIIIINNYCTIIN